jgi:hypothetical protein
MREITKTEIDSNTRLIIIFENGLEIARTATPSIWAFKNNTITDLDQALARLNKSALTTEEKAFLQSMMDAE